MQGVLYEENLVTEGHQVLLLVPSATLFVLLQLYGSSLQELWTTNYLKPIWWIDCSNDDLRYFSLTTAETLVAHLTLGPCITRLTRRRLPRR